MNPANAPDPLFDTVDIFVFFFFPPEVFVTVYGAGMGNPSAFPPSGENHAT